MEYETYARRVRELNELSDRENVLDRALDAVEKLDRALIDVDRAYGTDLYMIFVAASMTTIQGLERLKEGTHG